MDSYSELASCYDIFMEDVPYDEWLEYILDVFKRYKPSSVRCMLKTFVLNLNSTPFV